MASLLVVTGPPGAGKSTVATLLARRTSPSVVIAGDAFFAFLDQGALAPWLPESHAQNGVVTRAAAAATGQFARSYATVYDGVLGPWFIGTFATQAGLSVLDYAILMPSVETCVERVRNRDGHAFTDEAATRKMHEEFSRASVADRHVVREPQGTPESVADLVLARRDAGTLAYRAPGP